MPDDQRIAPELTLETHGVERYRWRTTFGDILIEVDEHGVKVNGDTVTSLEGAKHAGGC